MIAGVAQRIDDEFADEGTNGSTVRSPTLLEVVDGELTVIRPIDDDDDVPF